MDVATVVLCIEERVAARLLTTERAKSFLPSCHKEKAYTCKPSSSSAPKKYHTMVSTKMKISNKFSYHSLSKHPSQKKNKTKTYTKHAQITCFTFGTVQTNTQL